jgi:hypothetical protein
MTPDFRLPSFELSGKCPRCGIECRQEAFPVLKTIRPDVSLEDLRRSRDPYNPNKSIGLGLFADFFEYKERTVCRCSVCGSYSYWEDGKVVFLKPQGVKAHIDMPKDVAEVFNEAQAIYGNSPRAACAMLRIAAERLVNHLRPGSAKLADKIATLDINDLQRAILDACRLTGNEAVHRNVIDFSESNEEALETVKLLSNGINRLVDELITQPKEYEACIARMKAAREAKS